MTGHEKRDDIQPRDSGYGLRQAVQGKQDGYRSIVKDIYGE